ncbi:putative bifunctional diguanylate cyclase/phosphodiesterase [Aquipseudomonas guryensis]|jgi:diguanylate cyclase (GGDEF)-like protein/PAS domain S-box-containing protein|uniref:cyclic-guanylate-specific phosphodiesterase n=1 Tax=Aquipseudomonas guryensis TaxID=2759165 RepID=A0A7W4DER8_9GAMM|nr:EAL domain-containing protein [Pseudomonas guryensis]MBB1521250.1 EAL domain-containing protein [Pseudomonas guryensis]
MTYRVLIVTADATDCDGLQDMLIDAADGSFVNERVTRLDLALTRLQSSGIDAVLLDLALPDSVGLDTFLAVFAAVPHLPILTLCAPEDEPLALESLRCGAQGYLLKGRFASYLVAQSLSNIIQRKTVEARLLVEQERAETTLNSISDAVIGTDLQGCIDYLNLAAERMTGWTREEARGKPVAQVLQLINGVNDGVVPSPVDQVLQQGAEVGMAAGTILVRRDGSNVAIEDSAAPIHDPDGQISGAVVVFHDVTAARAMAMKMAYLAQHDFLTKLPNRVLLNDRIAQAISLAERSGNSIALMFLDLDNFKHINDSLGHGAGDKLLQSVALRLAKCVRNSDTVSRNGGDEFVVLLAEGRNMQDASLTAQKILAALAEPHRIDQHELHVTSSIGISVYPTDAGSAEALLKNADTAMYHAKEAGRNNYQFFKHDMTARAVERQVIESSLWHALERHEFVLHYQPKVNLQTGSITGAEALLRWVHPQWGMTLPERFMTVAEECGLIVQIGQWVLREACVQTRLWQAEGVLLPSIAVNVSALEFRHPGFVDGVRSILEETGLAPERLQLEITESVLMRDADTSATVLHQLKAMGVQLAIDDFGTGYSSLSYLLKFPIDVLKIDKSFVHAISAIQGNGIIVRAVIAMGASLHYQVVAEGVEDQAQLHFLKAEQCGEGQGFLFGQGLVAMQFATLLLASEASVTAAALAPVD